MGEVVVAGAGEFEGEDVGWENGGDLSGREVVEGDGGCRGGDGSDILGGGVTTLGCRRGVGGWSEDEYCGKYFLEYKISKNISESSF